MLKTKKIISFVLASALTLTGFSNLVLASGNSNIEAHAVLGSSTSYVNITNEKGFGNSLAYDVVTHDGKTGWMVTPVKTSYTTADNSEMYFKIDDSVISNVSDYRNYEIEVEYYDVGPARFRIMYDALPDIFADDGAINSIGRTEVVYTTGTNKWKTHSFIINDARFGNGYPNASASNCDFSIAFFEPGMGVSEQGVTIRRVSVRPMDTYASVQTKLTTANVGNNFFSKENVKINVNLKNTNSSSKTVQGKFVAYNEEGELANTFEFSKTIPANSSVTHVLDFKPKFGVYNAKLEIKADGIEVYDKIDYAYIVETDKNNPMMGIGNHSMSLENRDYTKLIPIMDKVGYTFVRDGFRMDELYANNGRERPLTFPERNVAVRTAYQEAGLNHLIGLNSEWMYNPYGSTQVDTEENMTLFTQYCGDVAEKFAGQGKYYEIMNEINDKTKKWAHLGYSNEWYAEMVERIYNEIKSKDSSAKIVAGVTSYYGEGFLRTMFENAIKSNYSITTGIVNTPLFDEVSVHPYTFVTGPDEVFDAHTYYSNIRRVRNLMDSMKKWGSYYLTDMPIRITEVGWSTATRFDNPDYTITKMEQAAYMPQVFAIYSNPELKISAVYFYDFINDGPDYTEIENNLGVIEHWEYVETPYLAKPGLLSIAFFNELLSDKTHISRQDDEKYHIYEYSKTDGRHVVMAWTKPENEMDNVTFNISDQSAKVYDMFGNEMDVLRNGTKISIGMQNRPIYIVGNFSGYSIDDTVEPVTFESEVTMTSGEYTEFAVTKAVSDDLVATLEFPEDSKVLITDETDFVDNVKTFKVYSYSARGKIVKAHLKITTQSGELVKEGDITFNINVKDHILITNTLELGVVKNFDEVTEYGDNCIIRACDGKKNVFELRPGAPAGVTSVISFAEQDSGVIKFSTDLNIAKGTTVKFFTQQYDGGAINEGFVAFDMGELKEWNLFGNWRNPTSFAQKVYYPEDEWFKFEIEIDFSTYVEKYFINGNLVATSTFVANPNNSYTKSDETVVSGKGYWRNVYTYSEANNYGVLLDNILIEEIETPIPEAPAVKSANYTDNGRIEVTFTEDVALPMSKNFSLSGSLGDAEVDLGLVSRSPKVNVQNEFWNFDDGVLPVEPGVDWLDLVEEDTNRGKSVKFNTNNRFLKLDLDTPWVFNAQAGRKYLYSLDMFIEDTDNSHKEGHYVHLRVLDNEGKINPIGLYVGRDHKIDNGSGMGGDGSGGYEVPIGDWFRVDMLLSEANSTATIYVDGKATGLSFSLPKDVNNGVFDGIKSLYIWDNLDFDSPTPEERLKVDNVRFKEVADTYEVGIEKDEDGNIVFDFDESIFISKDTVKLLVAENSRKEFVETDYTILTNNGTKAIIKPAKAFRASDIIKVNITATSVAGKPAGASVLGIQPPVDPNATKTVSVAVEQVDGNKLYILPGEMSEEYLYTLTFKGLKSKDGDSFPDGSVIVNMDKEPKKVNLSWDFEDGVVPEGNAYGAFIDEGYKTKVLQYSGSDKVAMFDLGERFTKGKYIYSMDVAQNGLTYFRVYDGTDLHYMDGILENHLREIYKTGGHYFLVNSFKPNIVPAGEWVRLDHVLDLDNMTNTVYINGEYAGEIDIDGRTAMSTGNLFSGISKLAFWDNADASANRLKLDNVRFKEYSDNFNASVKWEDGKIIIDFDETIKPVTNHDFVIYKAENAMYTPEKSFARVIYQDATRVVLEPYAHDIGTYFEIEVNATSFLGHKVRNNFFNVVAGDETQPAIGKIIFFDMNDNEYYADNAPTDTARIEITLPYGNKEGFENISLLSSSTDMSYSKSWDEERNVLTLIPTSALATSKTFTFLISAKASNGESYKEIEEALQAKSGRAKIKVNAIEIDSEGMYVNYSFASPKDSTAYTIICAGYKNGRLVAVGSEEIIANQYFARYEDVLDFPTDKAYECDKFIVYVWDGINTMVPLTEDLVQK